MEIVAPSRLLDPELHWQPAQRVVAPTGIGSWLADSGSLTRRLQRFGLFSVTPLSQRIARPQPVEALMLGQPPRQRALIREVLLRLDGTAVVFARSILPLSSLQGANRILGHMARRSLGAELFRAPVAERRAVWLARIPQHRLPVTAAQHCWGRQSLFYKRGQPLLVAEVFLPSFAVLAGID